MEVLNTLIANPWIAIVAIIIGFVLLIYGADWLVDGASALAKKYGVSNLVIGLTVVALGTSMPEFVVSIIAATQGNTEIAITNILGSNSMNIFVILGMSALIYPVTSKVQARRFDIPWSFWAGLLVFFFATYTRPQQLQWGDWGKFSLTNGFISGIGGCILLICLGIFLWHSFHCAKESNDDQNEIKTMTLGRALLLILLGLIGLMIGGELIVNSATSLAAEMGVSDAIIGLTIVALGTSLPELATSCMAAAKHNSDLALGNVIGSNIFNVFFILGTSAVIHPLPIYDGLWLDALMVILSSILVMCFVYFTKKHEIKRWHGALLLSVYIAYLVYRIITLP